MIWRFFLHKHVFIYIFFYFPNVFYAPAAAIVTRRAETCGRFLSAVTSSKAPFHEGRGERSEGSGPMK